MSSLKKKFDDYREEPQHASWQQLLKRLDAELPLKRKRKYFLWLIPLLFIGTTASWLLFNNSTQKNNLVTAPKPVEIPVNSTVAENIITATNPAAVATNPHRIINVQQSSRNIPATYTTPVSNPASAPAVTPIPVTSDPAPVSVTPLITETPALPASPAIPKPVVTNPVADKPASTTTDTTSNQPITNSNPASLDKIDTTASVTPIKPTYNPENRFLLEIYFAPGISNIILNNPTTSYFSSKTISNNISLRNGISKPGFNFTTGAGIKVNLTNSLRFKTGYYFTQVSQILYYNTQTAQCNCGQSVSLSQIDPNIKSSDISNTADTITNGNTYSFTNKYSLREIPFVFEYAMPLAKIKNVSSVINFGISYMYLSGVNEKMPDADNVGFVNTVYKTANVSIFPSYKDAFNAIIGYGFTYKVKRNVEWSVAPQFKIALTSLSKNDHWIREYPWQFQIGFGVGKRF